MARSNVLLASALVGLLVAAWLSPRAIPYNMDEFVHYHALACATAPEQRGLPVFRDGCGLYDLRLPLTTAPLPLRAYLYIGSLPAVPFYPFFRLLDDPVSARVQGAVFAIVGLLLASRLVRVRASSMALAFALLPVFLAAFLVDTGPVGLSAVLFLAALAALRQAFGSSLKKREPGERGRENGHRSLAWALTAGLLLFLGVWVKLVFAWWLPAVAYFTWAETRKGRGQGGGEGEPAPGAWRRRVPAFLALLMAFAMPTAILLASVDRDGRPYLHTALHRGRIDVGAEDVGEGAARLWSYAADASRVAPRNLVLPSWPVDALPGLLALAVAAAGARGRRRGEVAGWALLALATLAIASSSRFSRWPHHFFFPWLLVVLALAVALDALGRRARAGILVALAVLWTTLAVRWPSARIPTNSSFAKDEMLRTLRERGTTGEVVQVHSSWGTYYIAQLFGDPGRIVVYMRGISDDPALLARVRALAAERGRPVLLLSSRRWERLETPEVADALGPPARTWRFGEWWAVLYETPREDEQPRPGESSQDPEAARGGGPPIPSPVPRASPPP